MRRLLSVIAIIMVISACTASPGDQRFSNEIIGSWIMAGNSSDYYPINAREVFFANGTYKFYVYSDATCAHVVGYAVMDWKITNGVLTSTVIYASDPSLGPVGDVMRDRIVSISKTRMVLHSLDDGTTYARTRSTGCFAAKQTAI